MRQLVKTAVHTSLDPQYYRTHFRCRCGIPIVEPSINDDVLVWRLTRGHKLLRLESSLLVTGHIHVWAGNKPLCTTFGLLIMLVRARRVNMSAGRYLQPNNYHFRILQLQFPNVIS